MRVSHQNDALHRDLLSSLIYERSPDTANKLRFVVITGIDRDHPAWYRLLIAPNEEAMEARPGDHFVLVTRIHTMNAEDDNLIVPERIQDAPALRTLARKKQRNPKDPT